MKPSLHNLLDPTVFSCFSSSYYSAICNQLKWSTVSIINALLIIIVYATSGLYTLIDVTTLIAMNSVEGGNDTWPFHLESSSTSIHLRWVSMAIYFSIVLLVMILLCGIQFSQPWLLFIWSILMIIMLLVDGIVTVFSLRHNYHSHQVGSHRSAQQIQILFCVMIIRLTISLCGIFITIFHFRALSRAKSDHMNRQRMLERYNAESASPSFDQSWSRPGGYLMPSKEISDDHFIPDISEPVTLPRAKVATIQRHPTSTMFQARHSLTPRVPSSNEQRHHHHHLLPRPISEYNEGFQYNIPLQERFYHEKILNEQEL